MNILIAKLQVSYRENSYALETQKDEGKKLEILNIHPYIIQGPTNGGLNLLGNAGKLICQCQGERTTKLYKIFKKKTVKVFLNH